jgi:hypothetical protein
MRLSSIVLLLIGIGIGIAALAAGYYFTHGKPSTEDLKQIHEAAQAAAKQAAALQATLPRTPPAGSIQRATANVDVTIELPAGEKLLQDSGGYFAVAIRTQPVINPFGPDSKVVKLANRRSRWTAVWDLDPADPVIGSPMSNIRHADNCQLRFNGMPQNFAVISGKATVTLNGKLPLVFQIPSQIVSNGVMVVSNIAASLEPLEKASMP